MCARVRACACASGACACLSGRVSALIFCGSVIFYPAMLMLTTPLDTICFQVKKIFRASIGWY